MGIEISIRHRETGKSVYMVLVKGSNAGHIIASSGALEDPMVAANWGNYDIAMTEISLGYLYQANIPAGMALGHYTALFFVGNPAGIGDSQVGYYFFYFDGTNITEGGLASSAGAGAKKHTHTVTESGLPMADVDIWCSTDVAGDNIIASGKTDQNGEVIFFLDVGTVYMWRQKSGKNFTNPDTDTVS